MGDQDEYIKSLEEENKHMRNVLIGKYKSKARALNDGIDDYDLTCDDVGIRGDCGSSCPVFLRGKCAAPYEIIEGMEAYFNTIRKQIRIAYNRP